MNELVENSASNLDLVWSVRSIASVIRRSERQTYNLLETGRLPPARKVGGRWCASRAALKRFFEAE